MGDKLLKSVTEIIKKYELEILGEIHDIGKVAVSKSILNKEGKLEEYEWEEIKKQAI